MKERHFLFLMLDGWTNVFQVPGKRNTGTKAQTYAITGPGWTGKLPASVTEYKSPTGLVWILGRIYSSGPPADYKEVHALQDKVSVVPLSAYEKPYSPAPGTVDPGHRHGRSTQAGPGTDHGRVEGRHRRRRLQA
jgi:hypothetical protein